MELTIIALIVLLIGVWRFVPTKGVRSVMPKELREMIDDDDKIFIDVRTKGEFNARGLEGFENMPVGSDFSTLPKDKEIVVICQSGIRSMQVCKQLKKLGYEKVTNVRRGMNAFPQN